MTTTYEKRTQSHVGRFDHVERDYSMEDVQKLSGSVQIEYTLAKNGANNLWNLLQTEDYVPTWGYDRNQALQQVRAGLKSIYLSGWVQRIAILQVPCIQISQFIQQILDLNWPVV